jgi:hypothetical protein
MAPQRSIFLWQQLHCKRGTVFPTRSVPRWYKKGQLSAAPLEILGVEVRSNTSTVTLRVVGGDEKGSLESETVKYAIVTYSYVLQAFNKSHYQFTPRL